MPTKPSRDPDAQSLLAELIGFDTVSSNSNMELIDFIRQRTRKQMLE